MRADCILPNHNRYWQIQSALYNFALGPDLRICWKMYKTTQFSTHAPLHNGGRGVSDIGVTIIWIGADHSKRAILKTEPGDSEPGWGSSPQWSGPPLSPPRPWTNTKDHYNSTSAMLGKKLSPGIWGDRFNGLLPAWEAPVVQVVLYRTWKWTISFESTSEGGGRERARIQQLLQDHSFQDIHHLVGEPFPSYFHLVGSPLPSSPLGQELHWGSRSRPHTSWVESSFIRELLFFWWFSM